jgi:hypothetical protein
LTDEPLEPPWLRPWLQMNGLSSEKLPAEVQEVRKITHHFRGIYRLYLKLVKENQKGHIVELVNLDDRIFISPIMPKNLPGH